MTVANEYDVLHTEAKGIFFSALKACDIASSVDRRIRFEGNLLHQLEAGGSGRSTIDLNDFEEVFVIALGKAAGPMTDTLLSRMPRRAGLRGIYCSNQPPTQKDENFQYFEGGHPVPNEDSFAAARAALALLKTAGKSTLVFFLISGGGSAMFELPIDPKTTLPETIAFYELLLGSGAPIDEVNTLRKHFSAVKGGRLAMAAPDSTKVNLLVPDVPLQSLDALASGPTCPNRSTITDVRGLLDRYALGIKLPESMRRFLEEDSLANADTEAFRNSWFEVLLSSEDLVANARAFADRAGYYVVVDNSCDDWPYEQAAHYLLERFHALRRRHPRTCLISVGEVTVALNDRPGAGGRNQQFVLQCAIELDQYPGERLTVLSAGSDGIDGNTNAAGAVADVATATRARAVGYNPEIALATFDAYPLFAALGDLVLTTPTGQNLRDLRLLIGES